MVAGAANIIAQFLGEGRDKGDEGHLPSMAPQGQSQPIVAGHHCGDGLQTYQCSNAEGQNTHRKLFIRQTKEHEHRKWSNFVSGKWLET